ALRMEEPVQRGRREQDRTLQARAEQLGRLVAARHVDPDPWTEHDARERVPVRLDRAFVVGASVDVVEDGTREVSTRRVAQVVERGHGPSHGQAGYARSRAPGDGRSGHAARVSLTNVERGKPAWTTGSGSSTSSASALMTSDCSQRRHDGAD